jgi:Flp pilus assembly protein TadG
MARASKWPSMSCQCGSVAIEFALVLPVLALFLLGIMDTGRLLWTYTTLQRASEAAARCYAILAKGTGYDCTTSSGTQTYAVAQAWGLTVNASAFTVSSTANSPACGTQVVASYVFTFVIPWFYVASPLGTSNSITLTATACDPS